MLVSCGPQVKLDPIALENQYKELIPYWEMVIDGTAGTNKIAQIRFAEHFKEARDILNYYHDPLRHNDKEAPTDNNILWNLRLKLNYASKYTNELSMPR